MNEVLKRQLIVGQAAIWMACMVANTIAITVVENAYDEFRYGPVCTFASISIMLSMPFALAHLQRYLLQIERNFAGDSTE